jgi:malonate decarboxylase beta subunit
MDDASKVAAAVCEFVKTGRPSIHRSEQVDLYRQRIGALDTSKQIDPLSLGKLWNAKRGAQ